MVLPRPTRPGSFSGLMALYESNYVRLRWLLPDLKVLRHGGTRLVSSAGADFCLYLEVLDTARYTTTFRLTYFLDSEAGLVPDPDLRLRLYHDAGQLEAMACTSLHRHQALRAFRTSQGNELQRRWTRNMMLNKWLEYCAEHRHEFALPESGCWVGNASVVRPAIPLSCGVERARVPGKV